MNKEKTSQSQIRSRFLMVGLFILMLMLTMLSTAAQTVMIGEQKNGHHLYNLSQTIQTHQLPMKTLKENTDSIKKRRHTSPRNNINSMKPTKQRRSNTWNKFYKSKIWKELRDKKLQEQPICEECLLYDKITPAETVHHILPFSRAATDEERWRLFLDYTNLRSLCNACHRKIHRMINKCES